MRLILTEADISKLSPSARAELAALAFPRANTAPTEFPAGFTAEDYEGVVDLTPGQMEEFMEGCSEETKAGLRVIAENGPVIHGSLLDAAGVDNYRHFQSRVTKRTRTVTGDKAAYLFTWDDWKAAGGVGHYAVTPGTFRSLRIYFNLD